MFVFSASTSPTPLDSALNQIASDAESEPESAADQLKGDLYRVEEEISEDISPLYEQLSGILRRLEAMNATLTEGFRYALYALETIEEQINEAREEYQNVTGVANT